jgi:glutamate racemase
MIIDKYSSIGVFDSGIGGLSVLKQLLRFLPSESYIYLGDTARVPYGNKSDIVVKQYAKGCAEFLLNKGVKLIVIACNTVSAVALDNVKELGGNVPIIEMIRPAAAAAVKHSVNKRIGVIGTRASIRSHAYPNAILELSNGNKINVFSQPCPLFVPLVEEGFIEHSATQQIAEEYLSNLRKENIDTLVLGCTHYPMLSKLISDIIPNVNQIDSGEEASILALRLLTESDLLVNERKGLIDKPRIEFYVTDYPTHFYNLSQRFLGFTIDSPQLVEL